MLVIFSLIGRQPLPNLLPILDLKPTTAVLLYTGQTRDVTKRLQRALPEGCQSILYPVAAYDIGRTTAALRQLVQEKGWKPDEVLFNLTGGTKAMVLAAYQVAAQYRAPFIYLESEGKQNRLYRYAFDDTGNPYACENRLLDALLTIRDHLRVHVGDFQVVEFRKDDRGARFERAIYEALCSVVDEIVARVRIGGALEIDLVARCGNQVGVIEAKTGRGAKDGIDQLTTAAEPQYLGIYTQRLLVSDQLWDEKTSLKELARAHGVRLVELPSFGQNERLSCEDIERLQSAVCGALGREIKP